MRFLLTLLVLGYGIAASAQTFTIPHPTGAITCGSAAGVTCTDYGGIAVITVASTGCIAAAVTCDFTLATLPAKVRVTTVVATVTTTFACTATCTTATLSATVGKTAGGNEYLLSFDLDAAVATFGDAGTETGTSLAATGVFLGGDILPFDATTTFQTRVTSAAGNLGDGAATNLSQGSLTVYLEYTLFP